MIMNMINDTTPFDSGHSIEFDDLKTSQEIIIETQNSCYRFCVTDAHQRHGYLSGGSLGKQVQKAILLGTIFKKGGAYTTDPGGLKTEARAFFYIETESGMKHLVTSIITKLSQVDQTQDQRYLF